MALKTKKGVLLTLLTIVLFILMLGELITYVALNYNYAQLGSGLSQAATYSSFLPTLNSTTSSFVGTSLSKALNALIIYENTPALRKDNFINNTSRELAILMENGTIYGNNSVASYMGNATMSDYASQLQMEAAAENLNLTLANQKITVFQTSPSYINATYTASATISYPGGIFTYPVHASSGISLNGTLDLLSVEDAYPTKIDFTNQPISPSPIGGISGSVLSQPSSPPFNQHYLVLGSSSPFMFAYGSVVNESGTLDCSQIPAAYQNPNYILAIPDAANINSTICGMGGLVTSTPNTITPIKPYLVYNSSDPVDIFNYLKTGMKVLLDGRSRSLLNATMFDNAITGNYYFYSPSSSSYLQRSEGATGQSSGAGISSLSIVNRHVADFSNASPENITVNRTFITGNAIQFTISAWVYPASVQNSIIAGESGANFGTFGIFGLWLDSGGTFSKGTNYIAFGTNICGYIKTNSTYSLQPGEWYDVVGVYNKTGNSSIYIDGTRYASGNFALCTFNKSFTIGNTDGGSGWGFNGSISNVQLYNYTLSPLKITSLYYGGIARHPLSGSGLMGWWPLGGNANDYSGYNHNGTVSGTLTYSPPVNYTGNPLSGGSLSIPNSRIVAGSGCRGINNCSNPSVLVGETAGATYYLPFTYFNSGSSVSPIQVQVRLAPSLYSSIEAQNLGNIRFYYNNTELYSWCESNCSSSAGTAFFWVKIPSGVAISPAGQGTEITLDMYFLPKSVNYDGVYAGEAPQLSPVYAEYDNGGNVFNFYDNFAGVSLSNKWRIISDGGSGVISVNNGLTIKDTTGNWWGIESQSDYNPQTSAVDINGYFTSIGVNNALQFGWQQPQSITSFPYTLYNIFSALGYQYAIWNCSPTLGTCTASNIGPGSTSSPQVFSLWASPSASWASINYGPVTGDGGSFYSTTSAPICAYSLNATQSLFIQWIAVRSITSATGYPLAFVPSNTQPIKISDGGGSLGDIGNSQLPTTVKLNGNGYIEQQSGFGWMSSNTQPFSISLWVNPSSSNGVILDELGQPAPNSGWHDSWLDLVDGNVYMRLWNLACVNLGPIPNGKWTNIVMTYTGTTYTGYLNTIPSGSGSGTRSTPTGSGIYMFYPLGVPDSSNCGSGAAYKGLLSDYQFYQEALTQPQITSLYLNNSLPVSPYEYWPLSTSTNGAINITDAVYGDTAFFHTVPSNAICTVSNVISGSCGVSYYP